MVDRGNDIQQFIYCPFESINQIPQNKEDQMSVQSRIHFIALLMPNRNIIADHPHAHQDFLYAIAGARKEISGWMKTKSDEEFVVRAASRISGIESGASRFKRLWMGRIISHCKKQEP